MSSADKSIPVSKVCYCELEVINEVKFNQYDLVSFLHLLIK